jgi:hypothetical protein
MLGYLSGYPVGASCGEDVTYPFQSLYVIWELDLAYGVYLNTNCFTFMTIGAL